MKKRFLYSLFLCLPLMGLTQEEMDFSGEVAKMVPSINTPEASSMVEYGKTNVNLYTGTPDINIPLYNFKGRELDLSLSLAYDASGIKVEQQATWTGLGRDLIVGGRITRITNGLPDEYTNSTGI